MIELDDKSYIVGMWFSSNPKNNNDWMACVIADPKRPGKFKGWARFRITKDARIWNNDDEKRWTTFGSQGEETEEDMIFILTEMQKKIDMEYPMMDRIIVKGGLKDLIELSDGHDWLNMK